MEFDHYSQSYEGKLDESIAGLPGESRVFIESKVRLIQRLSRAWLVKPSAENRILDFGCGIGLLDSELKSEYPQLVGVDVSSQSLVVARRRNPDVEYLEIKNDEIPIEPSSVDLALAINVFHHIRPSDRAGTIAKIGRLLSPRGLLLVVEHNPLNPLTRLVVSRCEFDADAVLLSPSEVRRLGRACELKEVESGYILFFPWIHRILHRIEDGLSWLPMGAQYFVALRKSGV